MSCSPTSSGSGAGEGDRVGEGQGIEGQSKFEKVLGGAAAHSYLGQITSKSSTLRRFFFYLTCKSPVMPLGGGAAKVVHEPLTDGKKPTHFKKTREEADRRQQAPFKNRLYVLEEWLFKKQTTYCPRQLWTSVPTSRQNSL